MHDLKDKAVNLPNFRRKSIKKTAIFDLDETLVHCIDDPSVEPCHEILKVTFPNGEVAEAGMNYRPYMYECLRQVAQLYQVVIFTASHQAYADVVLNKIDPKGELIDYRLYRDSCYQTEEGVYIKDLRIIKNRDLKDMVIIDNAVYSFGF